MTIISRMTEMSELPGRHADTPTTPSTLRVESRWDSLWERLLNKIAPLGYEDELGFHYGLPPQRELFN